MLYKSFFKVLLFTYLFVPVLVVACGIYFPDQGSNPGPLHWEPGVLTTEPRGKPL